jgi:hypothetical protein
MSNEGKCHHPACNCIPSNKEKHCSAYCHDMGTLTELACKCGHAGCEEEMAHEG